MGKKVQNLVLKGIALLVLTFTVLFFIYLQDLKNYLFFALYNTSIIAIAGLLFLGISWKKLLKLKEIGYDCSKNLVFVIAGALFLLGRHYFFEVPFRAVLTIIGLSLIYLGTFGFELVKHFLKQFKKEAVISIVAFIILLTILIATNFQFFIRISLGL